MEGEVQIHKVPGNFHISSHDEQTLVNRLMYGGHHIDFTHEIKTLSFGDKEEEKIVKKRFGD